MQQLLKIRLQKVISKKIQMLKVLQLKMLMVAMHMAFPKGSKLTEEFNKELKALSDSGELDKIIKKYFDAE